MASEGRRRRDTTRMAHSPPCEVEVLVAAFGGKY